MLKVRAHVQLQQICHGIHLGFYVSHGNMGLFFSFLFQRMQILFSLKIFKKEHLQTRHTICSFCVLLIFFFLPTFWRQCLNSAGASSRPRKNYNLICMIWSWSAFGARISLVPSFDPLSLLPHTRCNIDIIPNTINTKISCTWSWTETWEKWENRNNAKVKFNILVNFSPNPLLEGNS